MYWPFHAESALLELPDGFLRVDREGHRTASISLTITSVDEQAEYVVMPMLEAS